MCGIIAVLSRPETRSVPVAADLLAQIEAIVTQWPLTGAALPSDEALVAMGKQMTAVDASLRGDAGLWLLAGNREFVAALGTALEQLQGRISAAEDALESSGALDAAVLEKRAGLLTVLRDAVWSIRMDRLRTAAAVDGLAGAGASRSALAAYLSIQQVFSGLDRLEVRGRDSAGVHVMVWGHGVSPDDARVRAMLGARHDDNLFTSGSVRITRAAWSFVYKAAAEIGELGDNTRVMRQAVVGDDLLRLLVSQQGARVAVLGHTRWASVGIISEPNAHPVNSEELESNADAAYLIAALNGDVDNHADLRARHELRLAQPITTDAKVIPALVSRRLAASTKDGSSTASTNGGGLTASANALADAFRETVASFEGSVAIAAASADNPESLLLALKGSGQGLCVGLAPNRFVVASEPYGLVEETQHYLRMDGESLAHADNPSSRGQVVVLDAARAGEAEGIRLVAYDGTALSLGSHNMLTAEVTTRDIDRGPHSHFLAKEITEAPRSFTKTLRGRLVQSGGALTVSLDESQLPQRIVDELSSGALQRIRESSAPPAGRPRTTARRSGLQAV